MPTPPRHPDPSSVTPAPKPCDGLPSVQEVVGRLDRLWTELPPEVPSPFASAAGTQVGPYIIERVIGRGGFGIVYKARNQQLNRDVALKVPRSEVLLDDEKLRRFEAEAQATAHLDHPSIVPLYKAELSGAMPYLASAYCPGPNLQQWLDENSGQQPCHEAAQFVATLADAVQYAHEQGIVHRDLKPSNILLMPVSAEFANPDSLTSYQPRLTDFGLSWFAESALATRSSLRLGTPLYMSPEQAFGKSDLHGPGVDLYSLGVLLYQLITGRLPFTGSSEFEIVQQILNSEPVAPDQLSDAIPRDLSSICLKCIDKEAQRRYISAAELRKDLLRFLRGEPTIARPMTWLGRSYRWVKRSRLKAALLFVCAASVIAAFAALEFHLYIRTQQAISLSEALSKARDDRGMALAARQDADVARKRAESEQQVAREISYRSDMRLAFQLWEQGLVHPVRELLLQQTAGTDRDLRGPEWYVLNAQLRAKWQELGQHTGAATECVLSPDRTRAYTSGVDGVIRIWDVQSGMQVSVLDPQIGEIHAMALSPDEKTLAVGGQAPTIGTTAVVLIDAVSGKRISSLQAHETTIESIRFSPDGRWLAAGSRYQAVQLTRLNDSETLILPSTRRNRSLSFSFDSKMLAVGAEDEYVALWDVEQDEPALLKQVDGHRDELPYIIRFATGENLLSTGYAHAPWVSLFDQPGNVIRGLAIKPASQSRSARFKSLAFTPQNTMLAAGDEAGSLVFWNLNLKRAGNSTELSPSGKFVSHESLVSCVEFIDESHLLSTGDDGRICVTSPLATGVIHHRWSGIVVNDVAADENELFLACSDGTIRRYNLTTGITQDSGGLLSTASAVTESQCPEVYLEFEETPQCLDISPGGGSIAVGTQQGSVRVYERNSGRMLMELAGPAQHESAASVLAVCFDSLGTSVASTGRSGFVHVYDASSGNLLLTHSVNTGHGLQFYDNDQFLACADNADNIDVFDVHTGHVVRRIASGAGEVLALSPDGTRLASGHDDGTLQFTDLTTDVVRVVARHRIGVPTLAFTPPGRTLISADRYGQIRFVDSATGTELGRLNLPDPLYDLHTIEVLVSRDRLAVVTSSKRTTITPAPSTDLYIWDLSAEKMVSGTEATVP